MKKILCLTFFLAVSSFSFADNHGGKNMAEAIDVKAAWARETFKMAKSGAAYLTLSNNSGKDAQLVSVSFGESIGEMVQIHTTVIEDNMMRMKELEDGVTIGAGETLTFQPGGMHLMLMGLNGPIELGKDFEIELSFADGSSKSTKVVVRDMRTATK